ncbi:hypothetical protein HU200_050726 [Digitaria exilis]|uniref:Large ribosomal subunit protein uL10-like insertion domain-containing protein n=1 Tax=Digitaria exilis TaxID=1010633 RepID=A0A835E8U4_9POAL|nr:hypothetical protein HU200_050726 [Digitaria exilis]
MTPSAKPPQPNMTGPSCRPRMETLAPNYKSHGRHFIPQVKATPPPPSALPFCSRKAWSSSSVYLHPHRSAVAARTKAEKKQAYDRKLCSLLDEYTKVLIALADNVGSKQLQDIRRGLRGDSVVLMGKNTLIRRCIKVYAEKTGNRTFDPLMDLLVGNVGLIFTKGDLKEVREEVLNIPTKINKGTVEIITPVELIKKGDKVGSSESALLAKLGIRPFSYGLQITNVYEDGSVFSPEDLIEKFATGVSMVASLSLALSKFAVAAPVLLWTLWCCSCSQGRREKKAEEPAEESDDDMGFSLFD